MAWARFRRIPVAAIEEVAQLGLNQFEINNYDAPFDQLFVASPDEFDRFIALRYPAGMLRVSGLLADDHLVGEPSAMAGETAVSLGIAGRPKPIVYTSVPTISRYSIHSKDGAAFREAVLTQLEKAGQISGRPVVIKLHPSEKRAETQVRANIRRFAPSAIVADSELPMDALFALAGVLVNRGNSQTCFDSVLKGIPTVVLSCGLPTLFHGAGVATIIETPEQLPEAIERALRQPPAGLDEFARRHRFRPAQGVAAWIAMELRLAVAGTTEPDGAKLDWLVRSLLFVGASAKALQLLERIGPSSVWRRLVSTALASQLGGRPEESIHAWLACSREDPAWFFPHFELAHAYAASGAFDAAIEHARMAIELHPLHYRPWHEIPMRVALAASLRALGRYDAAAAELQEMERRFLLDAAPELMLQKAALALDTKQPPAVAYDILTRMDATLTDFPISEAIDAALHNQARDLWPALAREAERQADYATALACYRRTAAGELDQALIAFASARLQLAQGRAFAAQHELFRVSGIVGAAELIAGYVLPEELARKIAGLWPRSRSDSALRIAARASIWLLEALKSNSIHRPNFIALWIVLAWFAAKHSVRRFI